MVRSGVPLPFSYQSTGSETRFTNGLDPEPRARGVFAFHRPEHLASLLEDQEPERASAVAEVRAPYVPYGDGLQVRPLPRRHTGTDFKSVPIPPPTSSPACNTCRR